MKKLLVDVELQVQHKPSLLAVNVAVTSHVKI